MYMTLSWIHTLAKYIIIGGANFRSVTIIDIIMTF